MLTLKMAGGVWLLIFIKHVAEKTGLCVCLHYVSLLLLEMWECETSHGVTNNSENLNLYKITKSNKNQIPPWP